MDLSRRQMLAGSSAVALAACAHRGGASVTGSGALPDATATAAMIRNGEITALEAVEAAIARAKSVQPQINFMVEDTFAAARVRAAESLSGPFAGVPYLVKDLNDVIGARTRKGSRSTAGVAPATEEMAFTRASLGAGLVCIGKSTTPENGYLPTTEPLAFEPTRNPWNTNHSSGGSSGGAAAAVAAGVVPMAHANDGGGSIRFPAANCGVFGLKPSRGRLIDDNPGARPLDIAVQGCVSRTVRDTAGFMAVTEATGDAAVYPPTGLVSAPTNRALRIGVITTGFIGNPASSEVMRAVNETVTLLESLGHATSETKWPTSAGFSDDFLAFWSLGAAYDVSEGAKLVGRPPDESMFEPFSLRMAQNATTLSPDDIEALQRRLLADEAAYNEWIGGYDVVLSPTFTSPPSPLGYLRGDVEFEELIERLRAEVGYTLIHNVAGTPAMSVPLTWSSDGLPIGMQFCAGVGEERLLLELAYELEAAQPWIDRHPPVWAG